MYSTELHTSTDCLEEKHSAEVNHVLGGAETSRRINWEWIIPISVGEALLAL